MWDALGLTSTPVTCLAPCSRHSAESMPVPTPMSSTHGGRFSVAVNSSMQALMAAPYLKLRSASSSMLKKYFAKPPCAGLYDMPPRGQCRAVAGPCGAFGGKKRVSSRLPLGVALPIPKMIAFSSPTTPLP